MGEYNLRKYMLNEKEADNTIFTSIAKAAGYASTFALSKNFSKPYSETSSFNRLLLMMKKVFPNDEKEAMSSHAMNDLDFNKKTARYMLEMKHKNTNSGE